MPAMWQAELRGIHIFSVMLLNQTFFVLYLFFRRHSLPFALYHLCIRIAEKRINSVLRNSRS